MPGLIANQLGTPNAAASKLPDDPNATANATATTYDPAQRTVDPNQTVAGQLGKILDSDSDYIRVNQTKALEDANARGIINSTIATGAGRKAAIESALPIAQQDAATNAQASSENTGAKNTALNQGAQLSTTASLSNAQNTTQQLLQRTAGTQASQLSAQQAEQAKDLQRRGGEISAQLQQLQARSASGLSAQEAEQQKTLLTQKGEIDKQLQELTASETSALSAQQAGQSRELTALQGQIDQQLQTLRGTQAEGIARIQGQYQQLIQANASAAQFFSNMLKNVTDSLNNQYTSVEQKQAAIDRQTQLLQSGLAIIGGISNLDLTKLLDFSPTGLNKPLPAPAPPPPPAPAFDPGTSGGGM